MKNTSYYDIYRKLGAHPIRSNGTDGVHFAVWAPNAAGVSVVGDFNDWDGSLLPMSGPGDSGIFELFVPGLEIGSVYQYEIRTGDGRRFLKSDPFANASQLRPDHASVVADISDYTWNDSKWMENRPVDVSNLPMAVCQVHLGMFMREEDGSFCSYEKLAEKIAVHVLKYGFTHVELLPVMEHPLDETYGYQISGYYAPTSRFGSPAGFMRFVDYMHERGIGVILAWSPSQFPADDFCLSEFDGTCLYEHLDPRQGVHPVYGSRLFNYGRQEVRDFLIGSALFWADVYHADGLRLDSVSSMLYLDYGKKAGQWVANIWGGNENLDAIDFIKELNYEMKKKHPGCLMIAEENTGYPLVTAPLQDGGLGFDLKWDNGWNDNILSYMQLDPIFRGPHHGELIFPMTYHETEHFMLALGRQATKGWNSLLLGMPGKKNKKISNLKALFGYWLTHPGKKLLFVENADGQDEYVSEALKDMLSLYRKKEALFLQDNGYEGFEWINNFSAIENMLVFLRKAEKDEDTLLIVINYSALTYEKRKIGVPWPGKYKEIFNSDNVRYGGEGHVNPRVKNAKQDECDGREWSVRITVPPLGISVFSCTPVQKR